MIQEGIFNAIKEDAYFKTLLENSNGTFRIYPHSLPENILNNYDTFITYSRISGNLDRHIGYEITTFQINCIAKKYDTAIEMAKKLEELLQFYQGKLGGKINVNRTLQVNKYDMYDKDTGLFMMPVEYKFIFK